MAELFFPEVGSPVYQGARTVAVGGGVAGHMVEVYVKGPSEATFITRIGSAQLDLVGRAVVGLNLNQPLRKGDMIVAIQEGGDLANPTRKVVTVAQVPPEALVLRERFAPPVVSTPLYACQAGFWVSKVVEGAHITSEWRRASDGVEYPQTDTPWGQGWVGAHPPGLAEKDTVSAKQEFPDQSNFPNPVSVPLPSEYSSPEVSVGPAPELQNDPQFQPSVKQEAVSLGAKVLVVCNTLTGARVRIYAEEVDPITNKTKVVEYGGGIAAGGCCWIGLDHPLSHPNPRAVQSLCGDQPASMPSAPVNIKSKIGTPTIYEPICPGSTEVTVLGTEVGATVVVEVKRKGQSTFIHGGAEAASGPVTTVNLGQIAQDGDEVRARQSNEGQQSANGWSPSASVRPTTKPTTDVWNDDHPNVRVFYLGQTVKFRAMDCQRSLAKEAAKVKVIHQPTGKEQSLIAPALTEINPGYFETDWQIPSQVSGVPLGKYIAQFTIPGESQPREISFSVVGLTVSDTYAILAVHNNAREDVRTRYPSSQYPSVKVPPPLTWSHDLAAEAQDWANQIVTVEHTLHHAEWGTERDAHGESIMLSPIGMQTPAQMAEGWITGQAHERDNFKAPCDVFGNACSTTGDWRHIGHYTQVVWRQTTAVGCGRAHDLTTVNPDPLYQNAEYLVGRYNPSGNGTGQPVFGPLPGDV